MTDPIIQLGVHCHDEDESGMYAPQWGKQEESSEVGMIQMSTAVVNPGAVVVHLHHTPEEEEETNLLK